MPCLLPGLSGLLHESHQKGRAWGGPGHLSRAGLFFLALFSLLANLISDLDLYLNLILPHIMLTTKVCHAHPFILNGRDRNTP